MDFTSLLQQLDNVSFNNQAMFSDKKNNNDISGIMYFDDEEYTQNANFLDDNDTQTLYEIKNSNIDNEVKVVDTFKQLSQKVSSHIDLEKYNLSRKFDNLTDSILNVLKFYNYNGKNIFFKKLLKDFDVLKLFKKFNYKKQIKKKVLRDLIINKEDTNDSVRQILVDYLNINLVVLSNEELKTYCKDGAFELFRPTIIIYEYNNTFHSLEDKITNNSIYTSEDHINLRLKKHMINKDIIKYKQEKKESVIKSMKKQEKPKEKSKTPLVDFKKMKVSDLRNLCEQYHIQTKEKVNGKMKNILKKVLVEQLKIILS